MHKSALYLFYIILLFDVYSQKATVNYLNSKDGLVDENIQDMLQDKEGFIWAATRIGISRWDGARFKNYTAKQFSEFGNGVAKISQLDMNHLLLLVKGNLYTFNTKSEKVQLVKNVKFENQVLNFFKLWDGNFLVYNYTKSTINILTTKLVVIKTHQLEIEVKASFFEGVQISNDKFIYSTGHKVFALSIDKGVIGLFRYQSKLAFEGKELIFPKFFDKTKKRIFYTSYFQNPAVTDENGNFILELKNQILSSVKQVVKIEKLDDNKYCIATKEAGAYFYEFNSNTLKIADSGINIANNYLSSVLKDNKNNLWLGGQNGISQLILPERNISFYPFENDLFSSVKQYNKIFYLFSGNTKKYYTFNPSMSAVNKFETSQHPKIWSGSFSNNTLHLYGYNHFTIDKNLQTLKITNNTEILPFFLESEIILLNHHTKNGETWYSGNKNKGLLRIKKNGEKQFYNKIANGIDAVTFEAVCENSNGDLIFSRIKTHYLLHWHAKTEKFEYIDIYKKLPITGGGNWDAAIDKNDIVWAANEGAGLIKYNTRTGNIEQLTLKDGLTNNFLLSVAVDNKNRIWFTTQRNLSCYVQETKRIINFDYSHGLPLYNYNSNSLAIDPISNYAVVAGTEGFMGLDLDELIIKYANRNIQLLIDKIRINKVNRTIDYLNGALLLQPNENFLQFDFIAKELSYAKSIEYSYRLVGAHADWRDVGNEFFASYPNLTAGNYQFEVRARFIGDSEWSYLDKPVIFSIALPFYKTWWFLTLIAIFSGIVIWLVIRWYYKQQIIKQQMIIKSQQAVENERTRIAADMHDDLGSGLTRLNYMTRLLDKSKDLSKDISKIRYASNELVENLDDIIWAMKEENNTLENLIAHIRSYTNEQLENYAIQSTFYHSENEIFDNTIISGEKRRHIFLIVKELINNIVKHSKATKVEVQIQYASSLKIVIHDNGIGRSDKNIKKGNGIGNILKRCNELNGTCLFENANGLKIILLIPL